MKKPILFLIAGIALGICVTFFFAGPAPFHFHGITPLGHPFMHGPKFGHFFGPMPGLRTLALLVLTVGFIYLARQAYLAKDSIAPWVFAGAALLFNPLLPLLHGPGFTTIAILIGAIAWVYYNDQYRNRLKTPTESLTDKTQSDPS